MRCAGGGNCAMSLASFKDRLDRVRHRFVSTLESKIDDAYQSLSSLADVTPAAATSVEETYRSIHSVVGLGPTVGFPSITRAARGVEEVLRTPYEKQRGLTADEILVLKKQLHTLREAASRELQFFYPHQAAAPPITTPRFRRDSSRALDRHKPGIRSASQRRCPQV